MNLKNVDRPEKNVVELEIEVGCEEFEAAVEKAYLKARGRISLPGFRPGKAPRKTIEKIYGGSVFYEDAVDIAYPIAYRAAVEQAGIEPVDQADVNIQEVSDKGFTFKAKVTVKPEVILGQYLGVAAARPSDEVAAESVEAEIHAMRAKNARITTVEREIKSGDTAVIDFEGFVDGQPFDGGKGENHSLDIGSGSFIPGFEEKLIGAKAGEERDVDVTFPAEYHASELAGKPAVFKVKVNEVKERELPELDDEFAKDVSEFDTMEELRASIKTRLSEAAKRQADMAFEDNVYSKVLENMEAEIPAIMIKNRASRLIEDFQYRIKSQYGIELDAYLNMTGMTLEQLQENYLPQAERQVKVTLLLEKVAQLEKIEVGDEEIGEEYEKLSNQYGMKLDQIKKLISEEGMRDDLIAMKATKLLVSSAVAEAAAAEEKEAKKPVKKAPSKAKKAEDAASTEGAEEKKAPKAKRAAKQPEKAE